MVKCPLGGKIASSKEPLIQNTILPSLTPPLSRRTAREKKKERRGEGGKVIKLERRGDEVKPPPEKKGER